MKPKSGSGTAIMRLIFSNTQPIFLGSIISAAVFFASRSCAQIQSPRETPAKVAQMITVRIEGATQGSGILVKNDSNRYTVLTAWHVVSGQKTEEELDIYTFDNEKHQAEKGSIQRLFNIDLAILTFSSPKSYQIAELGDSDRLELGDPVFVAGVPLPTSSVPKRILRFVNGNIIANTKVFMKNGYQLLYSNQTLPGMSGGPVLDQMGRLVGIHAAAEKADEISESSGKLIATNTNIAIPINYYRKTLINNTNEDTRSENIKYATNSNKSERVDARSPMLMQLINDLSKRNYVDADRTTEKMIVDSIQAESPIGAQDVSKLNCQLLTQIDQSWRDASNGKYGFTSQSEIMNSGFQDFEVYAGWRRGGFLTSTNDTNNDYPRGYFPRQVANGPLLLNLVNHFKSCAK